MEPVESHEAALQNLRQAELDSVKSWFRPHMRVLEIGGGSGYQARILADWGCDVTSLDVATRTTPGPQYYPVETYDGAHIPFDTATFDAVFSSNVLEHVRRPADLCAELHRVLVRGGIAIHFIPSSTWRLWTSLAHYAHLVRRVATRPLEPPSPREFTGPVDPVAPRGLLRRVLWAGPHGEYGSAFAELYFFRRTRWGQLLSDSGLDTIHAGGNGLFYTGYTLLPGLPLRVRRFAAHILGSSCHVFVMRSR